MRVLDSQAPRALPPSWGSARSWSSWRNGVLTNEPGPKLHFLVSDATRELCRVTLPLTAVENLEHLFPDEDLVRVKGTGLDLQQVVRRARQSNYAAQTLVDTKTDQRSYRIWIE